jgi:hypothetical protein
MNQRGLTSSSRSQAPKTLRIAGASRYSETPVIASSAPRLTIADAA